MALEELGEALVLRGSMNSWSLEECERRDMCIFDLDFCGGDARDLD